MTLPALPVLLALLAAAPAPRAARPTPAQAKAFVARVNADLKRLYARQQTAEWIKATYITDDTEQAAAWANEELLAYLSRAVKESLRYEGTAADPSTRRALKLLRLASMLPAPSDPAKRAELAGLSARLEGTYGKGRWCGEGGGEAAGGADCRDLEELTETMRTSRDPAALLDAWAGWHRISRPMKQDYARVVALANEGARELGFSDVGELWRSAYDLPPAAFERETERLWGQLRPFYEQLHCYVRARLQRQYGEALVPDGKPIPAHLLGNMWAQEWGALYPMLEPYPGVADLDVSAAMRRQGWDAVRVVKAGESFFTSLGLAPLPDTFWQRSMFTKPRDREVVCHASAWDVTYANDLRIKMCIRGDEEDLRVVHHELGHDYYFAYYWRLPALFQAGANEGFHEAIGDAIALSVTPGYLARLGLLPEAPRDDRAAVNFQLKTALDKLAFLPFGKLVDDWRAQVFSGEVGPDRYNAAWWALRERTQGVAAPVARTEADFDPGAKYHVPANVSYTRYFLAHVYQFQFHAALCRAAGHQGPLHECSIAGSRVAGDRLKAMLAMGASRPWPEAMEAITGQREADAGPLLEYFAPLRAWLERENAGRTCGW